MAAQLYNGKLKPTDLSSELLTQVLGDVRNGLGEGMGSDLQYSTNPKRTILLNRHLYRFSGAKTYQELAKMNFFLKDKTSFADFKKEALKMNAEYNLKNLQAEYVTANRTGEMIKKWDKYQEQSELYPNLKYKTANDSRVRLEHEQMHDVIKPINDPFWLSWYPPNGWRCRCYVTQTDEAPTGKIPKGNPTPGFTNNAAVSNHVFSEDEHPYFVFPETDIEKIKVSFENLKLTQPDYQVALTTEKAKLEVSTWADPVDVEMNIKTAKQIVEALNIDIKIRPHSNITGIKNPEYLIGGKLGDRKEQTGKGVSSNLSNAKKQNAKVLVFDVQEAYPFDLNRLKNNLKGNIIKNYKKGTFETLILVKGETVEEIQVAEWYK